MVKLHKKHLKVLPVLLIVGLSVGQANSAETPQAVAYSFIEDLSRVDYANAVHKVDRGWINQELALLGWPTLDSPEAIQDEFVREYLGPTKRDAINVPLPGIAELWANRKWPAILPLEPIQVNPTGWCGTDRFGSQPTETSPRLVISVSSESIQRTQGNVVVDVVRPGTPEFAIFDVSLEKDRWGEWLVVGAVDRQN